MAGTPICKIPMLCEHCGRGFETWRAKSCDLGMRGFEAEIASISPTVALRDSEDGPDNHWHACPHCDRKQSIDHADRWVISADMEGYDFHAADLVWFCKYCNRRSGRSEVCKRCKGTLIDTILRNRFSRNAARFVHFAIRSAIHQMYRNTTYPTSLRIQSGFVGIVTRKSTTRTGSETIYSRT